MGDGELGLERRSFWLLWTQVGNSEEQRAKTESHGNFLKEGQHAAAPRLLLANGLASLSPWQGVLLPEDAKLIRNTCQVPGHSWEQAG